MFNILDESEEDGVFITFSYDFPEVGVLTCELATLSSIISNFRLLISDITRSGVLLDLALYS